MLSDRMVRLLPDAESSSVSVCQTHGAEHLLVVFSAQYCCCFFVLTSIRSLSFDNFYPYWSDCVAACCCCCSCSCTRHRHLIWFCWFCSVIRSLAEYEDGSSTHSMQQPVVKDCNVAYFSYTPSAVLHRPYHTQSNVATVLQCHLKCWVRSRAQTAEFIICGNHRKNIFRIILKFQIPFPKWKETNITLWLVPIDEHYKREIKTYLCWLKIVFKNKTVFFVNS